MPTPAAYNGTTSTSQARSAGSNAFASGSVDVSTGVTGARITVLPAPEAGVAWEINSLIINTIAAPGAARLLTLTDGTTTWLFGLPVTPNLLQPPLTFPTPIRLAAAQALVAFLNIADAASTEFVAVNASKVSP